MEARMLHAMVAEQGLRRLQVLTTGEEALMALLTAKQHYLKHLKARLAALEVCLVVEEWWSAVRGLQLSPKEEAALSDVMVWHCH